MWKPFEPDVFTQLGRPSSVEQVAQRQRRRAQHLRLVSGRVEVEDADVGVVQVRRARRPDVRRDACSGSPSRAAIACRVTSGWCTVPPFFGTSTRSSHSGKPFETSFCKKPFFADAGRVALHRDRTAADVRQHDRRDRLVVGGELALGDPVVGEQHLLGMRDHDVSLHDLARRLVGADAEQPRMAQLAVHRPLDERDLHDDLGPHPVRAQARQPDGLGERRLRDLERVQPRAQIEQQLRVEAGADLAGEDEVVPLEVADEQRAQADARALRIGEPADHELLRRLALHLQPVRRAAVLVRRVAPLRDDALPALAARALPRLRIVERRHALQRRLEAAGRSAARGARRAAATSRRGRRATGCRRRGRRRSPVPQVTSPSRITSSHRQARDRLRRRRGCSAAAGCARTAGRPVPCLNASRRMPSNLRSKIHSGPVNRSCVSVAAIGSTHSGNGSHRTS